MIRRLLKSLVQRALGRSKPAPAPVRSAPRPPPPLRPSRESSGHDHGHDHGGGGHDHGHDHGGAKEPTRAPEARVRVWTSETPNPHAMKFTASVQIVELGAWSFNSVQEAEKYPLGRALWALDGVSGVFAVRDFVTVTRRAEASWDTLAPQIVEALSSVLSER